MKTTAAPGQYLARMNRASAIIGETTGARFGISSGRYFSTYATIAGHGVVITGVRVLLASSSR